MFSVGRVLVCRLYAVASEWGKARLGILKGHRGMGGRGGVFEASGVFIRVRF